MKPKVYKIGRFWYASVAGHLPTGWGSFDTAIYWVGCYYMNPGASTEELNRMTNQHPATPAWGCYRLWFSGALCGCKHTKKPTRDLY